MTGYLAPLAIALLAGLAGCGSKDGSRPAVFGAVFGLDSAGSVPYDVGKIPEPAVKPEDSVVGDAANNPGQCIWRNANGRRYRAGCPEGYRLGN